MWLTSLLPSWVFHALTLAGVLCMVASLLPIPLKSIVVPIGALMLVFGAYTEGGIARDKSWALRVAAAEAAVAKKEAVSAQVTTRVVTKYINNTRVVREKGDVIIKEVPKYVTVADDARCVVPIGFVRVHDGASSNSVPTASRGADEGTPEVKISAVAATVVDNYTTYYEVAEQLKSLQAWIKQQQSLFNK